MKDAVLKYAHDRIVWAKVRTEASTADGLTKQVRFDMLLSALRYAEDAHGGLNALPRRAGGDEKVERMRGVASELATLAADALTDVCFPNRPRRRTNRVLQATLEGITV